MQYYNHSADNEDDAQYNNEVRPAHPTTLPSPISVADSTQSRLKEKIREIQASPHLTPKQKAESVQNLMMEKWNTSQNSRTLARMESPGHLQRTIVTYYDEKNQVLGCRHYQRGCKLLAKCCNNWYTCRFCHDEAENHAFDRYATERVSCLSCNTEQDVNVSCINKACEKIFAAYFCSYCKFYDNDATKEIYHCAKCQICRIGKGLDIDYFHCDRCNACMSISLRNHKCVERSLESDCPICHTYMFTSTTPVMFLPCGHCMHVACYEEYTVTNYICPLCSKSLGDMDAYFASIDQHMANEVMPQEYRAWKSLIYCSDCERKSLTSFHFIYHKCQFEDCRSYNTKVVQQFRDGNSQSNDEAPQPLFIQQVDTPQRD